MVLRRGWAGVRSELQDSHRQEIEDGQADHFTTPSIAEKRGGITAIAVDCCDL